jgi:hypothetical protein
MVGEKLLLLNSPPTTAFDIIAPTSPISRHPYQRSINPCRHTFPGTPRHWFTHPPTTTSPPTDSTPSARSTSSPFHPCARASPGAAPRHHRFRPVT